jgi:hypothetical protein
LVLLAALDALPEEELELDEAGAEELAELAGALDDDESLALEPLSEPELEPESEPVLEPVLEPLLEPESEPEALPPDAPPPAAASAAVLPTAASLVLLVPPALLRKSVTYQPEPLSWKPAAVTCFS